MMIYKNRFAIFVLVAAVLANMACSVSLPGSSTAVPTPEATQPAATQVPALVATKAAAALPTAGQTGTQLPGVSGNLDALDSYHMSLAITITGTNQAKKAVTQNISLLQEVIKSKNESHIQMSGISLAGASDNGLLDIYQMDKQSYMDSKSGDSNAAPSCISFSSDKPTFNENSLLKPDQLLKDVQIVATIAKGEHVNGVTADHYKVTQADFGYGTITHSNGELWSAQDGRYAVKYTGIADGTFDFSGDSIVGSMTWDYELTAINSLAAITLPAECQSEQNALGDLPVPPNATDIGNLGTLVTFSSPDKPSAVADFFRQALPGKGWKITNDSGLGADLFTLDISKGDQNKTIMITGDSQTNGSSVLITSK